MSNRPKVTAPSPTREVDINNPDTLNINSPTQSTGTPDNSRQVTPQEYWHWISNLIADIYGLKQTTIELADRIEQVEKAPIATNLPSSTLTSSPLPNADVLRDISDTFNTVHRYIEAIQRYIARNAQEIRTLKHAASSKPSQSVTNDYVKTEHQQSGKQGPTARETIAPKPAERPPPQKSTKVAVVGSSVVRGIGALLQSRGIDACTYTNPRCGAEHISPRVESMTTAADEVIVLAAETNNIPSDGAADAIINIGKMIDHTRDIRPSSNIIIPQLLYRYDEINHDNLNRRIDAVNIFLRHKCAKDASLHYLKLHVISKKKYRLGLNLTRSGKIKYADAILSEITRLTQT